LFREKRKMDYKINKLHYGGKLMPWAKSCIVKNPKAIIFLAGTEGRDPATDDVVEGIEAQTLMCLEKLKQNAEEVGSSMDYVCSMTIFIKGQEFPEGIDNYEPFQKAKKVLDEFFEKHCGARPIPLPNIPESNDWKPNGQEKPLVLNLIGVSGLAKKEMLIEISAVAVVP
jgi:enamine deaminase RidA (YjgF/YER057c/UK114 family)